MFTKMDMMKVMVMLLLAFLNQNICGDNKLQPIIAQYDHQYGPNALLAKAYCSYMLPEYHATKISVRYAIPTMVPVNNKTLFMDSICANVIYSSRFMIFLATNISVNTIAKPEKIAPATKYGGMIVVCQPGTTEVAKSKDTIVCTDNTNGVDKPANINDNDSQRSQCFAVPIHPNDKKL